MVSETVLTADIFLTLKFEFAQNKLTLLGKLKYVKFSKKKLKICAKKNKNI